MVFCAQLFQQRGGFQRVLEVAADGHKANIKIPDAERTQELRIGAVADLCVGDKRKHIVDPFLIGIDCHDLFRSGSDPYLYPNVDWQNETLKKFAWSHKAGVDISGGTKFVKYYGFLSYLYDGDILRGRDFGHAHFLIEKSVEHASTVSRIHPLREEESIEELARMLGGVEITDTVLQNAREMKRLAEKYE